MQLKPGVPSQTAADLLKHEALTKVAIGAFYDVFNQLGHGFLESVYESALAISLKEAGVGFKRQEEVKVFFRGNCVGTFIADLIVEDKVVLELKAARTLTSVHQAQLLNLLKATRLEVGLLLNFGLKAEFKRLVYSNSNASYLMAPE